MKKDKILNSNLIKEIASIGHMQHIVICDAGLPIPKGVRVIDLSLKRGIPGMMQVLEAIDEELVSESYILAEELKEVNPGLIQEIAGLMGERPAAYVTHEEFKNMTHEAHAVIRTGETSSYANIILTAGVNF